MSTPSSTIVVLVPGTTGSTLVTGLQPYSSSIPVWPASVLGPIEGSSPPSSLAEMAAEALLKETLYPGVLLGTGSFAPGTTTALSSATTGYAPFINYFLEMGSFTYYPAQWSGPSGSPSSGWGLPSSLSSNLLVAFPYDWRQDCATSAQQLQGFLGTIASLYESTPYQLYLVAHSMGGLVCRAYLETGLASANGQPQVQALITLGTPHLGAPEALAGIMGTLPGFTGEIDTTEVIFTPQAIDTLAVNFVDSRYSDSTFELLPPNVAVSPSSVTQFITDNGQSYSIFDAPGEVTKTIQTSILANGLPGFVNTYTNNLNAASSFFGTLDYTGARTATPYYCVYGTNAPPLTPGSPSGTCVGYNYASGTLTQVRAPDGDDVVPALSAQFVSRTVAGVYEASGVNHFGLPTDPGVQAQVASWMGLSSPVSGSGGSSVRLPGVVVAAEITAGAD